MIDPKDYYEQTKIYIKDGKLYRVLSYCSEPSIKMIAISTDHTHSFGVGGLSNGDFMPVPNLKYNHGTGLMEVIYDG